MKPRCIAFLSCSVQLPAVLVFLGLSTAWGQLPANTPQLGGPGVQAARDAREQAILGDCKHPPAPRPPPGGGFRRPPPHIGPYAYTVTAIPGVIAAGQQWTLVWTANGNNADGIIGQPDGSILIAQNDNSDVVKVEPDGHSSIVYRDTDTGGALSENKQGVTFIAERALIASIWELAPQRKLLADTYQGDPLDCIGGVLNDLTAAANGGVYFSMGSIYYANPQGVITLQAKNLPFTNGIVLSPDEKTLYVTGPGTLVTFDVQADGSLTNQRTRAMLPGGGGDGSTVDSEGRVYITGYHGVRVFSKDAKYLGTIPAPYNLVSAAFAGRDKKTLFVVAGATSPSGRIIELYSIPMIAQGYLDRAK